MLRVRFGGCMLCLGGRVGGGCCWRGKSSWGGSSSWGSIGAWLDRDGRVRCGCWGGCGALGNHAKAAAPGDGRLGAGSCGLSGCHGLSGRHGGSDGPAADCAVPNIPGWRPGPWRSAPSQTGAGCSGRLPMRADC